MTLNNMIDADEAKKIRLIQIINNDGEHSCFKAAKIYVQEYATIAELYELRDLMNTILLGNSDNTNE